MSSDELIRELVAAVQYLLPDAHYAVEHQPISNEELAAHDHRIYQITELIKPYTDGGADE